MANDDKIDFCGVAATGIMMAFFWCAWIFWVLGAHKSTAAVLGLVVVCLILCWITLLCRRQLAYFVLGLVLSPFVLGYVLVFSISSLIQLVFSPICVISIPPFKRAESQGNYCRLCDKCEAIVEHSPLLVGSPWILTRSTQKHDFYNQADLTKSADGCHLCHLHWHSVEAFQQHPESDTHQHDSDLRRNQICNSSADKAVVPRNALSTGSAGDESSAHEERRDASDSVSGNLTVTVWMQRYFLKKPLVRMRLCGDSIIKLATLTIHRDENDALRHRCYDSLCTDSPEMIEWAKQWIENCSKNHKLCRNQFVADESRKYLPMRLLDVEDRQDGQVRLISTEHLQDRGDVEYLALSHCWGGTVNVKLTEGNCEAMSRIQVQSLPRNFQDTVSITRQLGLRYLWIDSLCIVQDDDVEWEIQSANMGLVYSNAKCVISATASKDSTGGCFLSKDLIYEDCVLRKQGRKLVVVRSGQKHPDLWDLFREKVEEAPVTTRGWTFQERYLAGRVLHFCDGVVLFECNKLMASEHYNDGQEYLKRPNIRSDGKLHSPADHQAVETQIAKYYPAPPRRDRYVTPKYHRIARKGWERRRIVDPLYIAQQEKINVMLDASARLGVRGAFELLWRFHGETLPERIEFHHSWYDTVEQYSTRNLTRGTDKVKAMSGISYFIQKNTGFKYAAGLWSGVLPFNLLWVLLSNPGARPARSVPTWSWASVDGKISHRLHVYGSPSVNYYLGKFSAFDKTRFQSTWEEVTPLISNETVLAKEEVNGLVHDATLTLCCQLCEFDGDKFNVTFDIDMQSSVEGLVCLPVLKFRNAHVHPLNSDMQLHGIVLRAREEWMDRYERVGYFWTADPTVLKELISTGYGRKSVIEIV